MEPPKNLTLDQAEEWQSRLAARVNPRADAAAFAPGRTVAVLRFDPVERRGRVRARGAVVRWSTREVLERAAVEWKATDLFPFVPGLEGFREAPILRAVLDQFKTVPDVLMVDGAGIAHRRRFGVACHLGVAVDKPSFGVSTLCDYGTWETPPPGLDGAHVFVKDAGGEPLGVALRAVAYKDPLFVSPGHRAGVLPAIDVALALIEGRSAPDPFWVLAPAEKKRRTSSRPRAAPTSKKRGKKT